MIDALRGQFSELSVENIKMVAYVAVVAATVAICAVAIFFTFHAATAALVAGHVVRAYVLRGIAEGLIVGQFFSVISAVPIGLSDESLSTKVGQFVLVTLGLSAFFAAFGALDGALYGREVAWLLSSVH